MGSSRTEAREVRRSVLIKHSELFLTEVHSNRCQQALECVEEVIIQFRDNGDISGDE